MTLEGPSSPPLLEPAGFFVLRTPLLPFDELLAWSDGLAAARAPDEAAALEAALAHDRQLLRRRLRDAVARLEVREALFLASPSLEESLAEWMARPDSERGQKVERTLVRYWARLTARATPFGLFAGCSLGRIGAVTRLALSARTRYRRHARLDGNYLSALADRVRADPALRRALAFQPNSSLYRAAGQWRYAEARLDGGNRAYFLVAVEASEFLDSVLSRAAGGAAWDDLVAALRARDVSEAEAEEFLDQLVDRQLLVAQLEPQVTGPEPIDAMIAQLRAGGPTAPLAAPLASAGAALAGLSTAPLGAPPDAYRAIARELAALPAEIDPAALFQVDLVKPAPDATLGAEVLAEIRRGVSLLQRLAAPSPDEALAEFRAAFEARYEGREVPLGEALDEEAGIGFPARRAGTVAASPLLRGLDRPATRGATGGPDRPAPGPGFALLLGKLQAAARAGADEIVLDERDLAAMAPRAGAGAAPPHAMAALLTLAAASDEAWAAGDFQVWLRALIGPPAASLLGRFCHADEALTAEVRALLRAEEAHRPEAIFAEIVHLPEGRMGNVLLRPLLRRWELEYLGRSGAPAAQRLRLDDLVVSVRDDRIVLRSRRLGREVIPRLTTAHNYARAGNLGVYKFLCALQGQAALTFDWGALEAAPFLPRVRSGRVVLAAAQWRLGREALEPLAHAAATERFAAARALRRRHGLPRCVALVEDDTALPIDWDNVLSVESFAQLVRGRAHVTLTEMPPHEQLCARGPEGRFVHELILPLVAPPPAGAAPIARPTRDDAASSTPGAAAVPRRRPPGSEWLYAKLYAGAAAGELVLCRTLAPLVDDALRAGAADAWFFVRYADPDVHLRLRLRGDPARLHAEVLPALQARAAEAIADGLVWKLQLDTYEREVERYGGAAGLALSEQLFFADSEAVLAILHRLGGDEGADLRWRVALRGMDALLDDLGFAPAQKHALVSGCRDGSLRALGWSADLARQLGARFRPERLPLEALLAPDGDRDPPLADACAPLRRRSERLRPLGAALRRLAASGELSAPLADLAASYLHMHANRLFAGDARPLELVLYDFLARLYKGQLARRPRP